MKRFTATGGLLITVLMIALLAGCGGGDDTTSGEASSGESTSGSDNSEATASAENATEEPATKPDRLIVRFAGSDYGELMERTVVDTFTKETGIPVTVDNTEEYTAFAKNLQAIEAGQRPPVDCQINNQPYAYLNAVRDFSLPISPEVAPNLNLVEEAVAKPTGLPLNNDGTWPYTGIYQLSVPFVEDANAIPADAVTSWLELEDPALKQSIAIDGAYQSSAFGIAKALGVEPRTTPPAWIPFGTSCTRSAATARFSAPASTPSARSRRVR